MQAVVIDRFGTVPELREIAEPRCPAAGAVIRVAATGLCRSDWHGWVGHAPEIVLPHVPGHEFAGPVVDVGAGGAVGGRSTGDDAVHWSVRIVRAVPGGWLGLSAIAIAASSLCVAFALLEHGLSSAIVVAVSIVVLFHLEGHLLQPVIVSRAVSVHPLAIALTVITDATLGGIPGALIAVPLVAFLNTTVPVLRAPAVRD